MMSSNDHQRQAAEKSDEACKLRNAHEFDKAAESYRSTIEWCKGKLPNNDGLVLFCQGELAYCLHKLKRYSEAAVINRKFYDYWRNTGALDTANRLAVQQNLAIELQELGQYEEAVSVNEVTLAARTKLDEQAGRKQESHDTMITRHYLAWNYHELRRYEDAASLNESILATHLATLEEDDPKVIISRHNLASNLSALDELESTIRAASLHTINLEILKVQKGEKDRDTLSTARGLRICEEAIVKMERAVATKKSQYSQASKKRLKGDQPRARSSSALNLKAESTGEVLSRSRSVNEKKRQKPEPESSFSGGLTPKKGSTDAKSTVSSGLKQASEVHPKGSVTLWNYSMQED